MHKKIRGSKLKPFSSSDKWSMIGHFQRETIYTLHGHILGAAENTDSLHGHILDAVLCAKLLILPMDIF